MIHVVIGTRAQLVKMLPVMQLMKDKGWDYNFVFLPQHRETIQAMLDEFELKAPDVVVTDNASDIVKTWQMALWSIKVLVQGILQRKRIFRTDRSGVALVHGDAPPLLLGALIAKAQGLKVAQVEAGLRSFDFKAPFPEELIRYMAGRLGLIDLHFCQDDTALTNAGKYPGKAIHTLGNTILDTLHMVEGMTPEVPKEKYALVSLHRYETITDSARMGRIIDKLIQLSARMRLKFILHPPTQAALVSHDLISKLEASERIDLLPRMSFVNFQRALAQAELLVSDGGSNQEESAYLGIPCLLLRETTERSEGLGRNVVLSKFDEQVIEDFFADYPRFAVRTEMKDRSPSEIILNEIEEYV